MMKQIKKEGMMTMCNSERQHIKFTVIIPTRERCDTLESTLKTCVVQDYDNLEIIVSDNFSQDKTKEVVHSFKDKRIRYINTGKRLSMSHNWEFALSHVQDGYVMILGDDDGLLPDALAELNEIITEKSCEIISWEYAYYFWPNNIDLDKRNILNIPLKKSLIEYSAEEMFTKVIRFTHHYHILPNIYKSIVSYSTIQKVVQESGKFFHSMCPDISSGIALALVLKTYYYSLKPYSIAGMSHHSTGTSSQSLAGIVRTSGSNNRHAVDKFISDGYISFHNKLNFYLASENNETKYKNALRVDNNKPDIPFMMPIFVADAVLHLRDHLPSAKHLEVDIKEVLRATVKQAVYSPRTHYDAVIDIVKKIAHHNGISGSLPQIVIKHKYEVPPSKPAVGVNIIRENLILDCTDFNVQNVYDASLLCQYIMKLEESGCFSMKRTLKIALGHIKNFVVRGFIKRELVKERVYRYLKTKKGDFRIILTRQLKRN